MIDLKMLEKTGLTPDEYVYLYKAYYSDVTPVKVRVNLDALKEYLVDNVLTDKGKALFNKNIDWIQEWRELFPNIKIQGYPLRGDYQGCLKKMKSFVSKNNYTKEEIFKATGTYINDQRREGFRYTKLAHYFIEKEGISTLSAYCENLDKNINPIEINKTQKGAENF